MYGFYIGKPNSKMSCIQQNFPSKFEPNDAFYEKLEENTFVAFILKHPVYRQKVLIQADECPILENTNKWHIIMGHA